MIYKETPGGQIFKEHLWTTTTEICSASVLTIFLFFFDKYVLLCCRCLMSTFSKILILVCRKIFSAFYPILDGTFPNRCDFPLIWEFNLFSPHLVLYDKNDFCSILTNLSNLSLSKLPFLFQQKFPLLSSDLKNALTKHSPKMQPFANVFQNRCSSIFLNIHKKIYVLESLFKVFSWEYQNIFANSFFIKHLCSNWRHQIM